MDELASVFHFDEEPDNFEGLGQQNGARYWSARDFMVWLGYDNFNTFHNAVNKAIGTCTTLKISVADNFQQIERSINGQSILDYKLSRFGCYLIAINGDVRKKRVAAAQAYFVSVAEAVRSYIQNAENVERVLVREEMSDREVTLSGVAKAAGVEFYPYFQNAGYRGMYNMDLSTLKRLKGVDAKRSLLDFMGKDELAANLFRLTQTEAKIKNESIRGQVALENAARTVGSKVRSTMIEISKTTPESLPITTDINAVRGNLKKTQREFNKMDNPKVKRLPPSRE